MRYIVMDIGCLECGLPSRLVGVYDKEIDAEQARAQVQEEIDWRWPGQHSAEVFPFEDAQAGGEPTFS